jgi:pyruvate ferredoxin oxidoreductase gamma subunit
MTTEVRIHGRGGQGVVTSAELLASAAFLDDRHAQAFPSFGSERTGAPVVSFCRIADRPIRTREPIASPGILVIQDPTLLHQVDVFGGLQNGGCVFLNTSRSVADLGLGDVAERFRLVTVPATDLARKHLGRALPGAPLLGALCAVTGVVSLRALGEAIAERFPEALARRNTAAAREAHDLEAVHA